MKLWPDEASALGAYQGVLPSAPYILTTAPSMVCESMEDTCSLAGAYISSAPIGPTYVDDGRRPTRRRPGL
jgi:hypothetical protein